MIKAFMDALPAKTSPGKTRRIDDIMAFLESGRKVAEVTDDSSDAVSLRSAYVYGIRSCKVGKQVFVVMRNKRIFLVRKEPMH